MRLWANIDPFAPDAEPSLLDDGLEYLAQANAADIPFGLFRTSGWAWHNCGMTAVQELAWVLASLVEIMRGGMAGPRFERFGIKVISFIGFAR